MQMLVDIHVHLADFRFPPPEESVRSAQAAGVGWLLGTASQSKDWEVLLSLAGRFPGCHSALGIHPWFADQWSPVIAEKLRRVLQTSQVAAVGEIGLDFARGRGNRNNQLICFEEQLRLANEFKKPAVLHVYKAWPAIRQSLASAGLESGGIWHGFSHGPELAKEALDMGLYLAFGGGVIDENRHRCRAAAASVPDDYLLVESDGPNPSAPATGVVDVYKALAALRGVSVSSLTAIVARNTARLFG